MVVVVVVVVVIVVVVVDVVVVVVVVVDDVFKSISRVWDIVVCVHAHRHILGGMYNEGAHLHSNLILI